MKRSLSFTLAAMTGAVLLAASSDLKAQDATKQPAPGAEAHKGKRHGHFGPDKARWGRGHGGGYRMLGLTDDQKAKIKEIRESYRPKFEEIAKEAREKFADAREEMEKEIRPLLTPEQQKVLDDMAAVREAQQDLRESAAAVKDKE